MKRIPELTVRHPVAAFFLIAFAITWPCEIIYFSSPAGSTVAELLGLLAMLSPAIAATVIAGIEQPGPKGSARPRWQAFLAAWLLCAPIAMVYHWGVQGLNGAATVLSGAIVALCPAWIFSNVYARAPGIRQHFSTLLKPRGSAWWYLVIFLIFPGTLLLGTGITRLMGGEAEFFLSDRPLGVAIVVLLLQFVYGFLLTGGINEESGWRGFALPRLQARYPVIVSAGIVWFFWAAWHIPYDVGRSTSIEQMLTNRLFYNLLFSIMMVWLYNRTRGSILAPAMFHSAMNAFGDAFQATPVTTALFVLMAIFAILHDRMWEKLPADDPAAHATRPQPTGVAPIPAHGVVG